MYRKKDSQDFLSCVNWLVPGSKGNGNIVQSEGCFFRFFSFYYRHLYMNDSNRCEFDFECDCVIGNVTLVSNILNSCF